MLIAKQLTRQQAQLIKRVIKIQLYVLEDLLHNQIDDKDMVLFCLEHGIEPDDLDCFLEQRIDRFKEVYKYPKMVFNMNEDDTSIIRFILMNCIESHSAKPAVWRKLELTENLKTYSNQN